MWWSMLVVIVGPLCIGRTTCTVVPSDTAIKMSLIFGVLGTLLCPAVSMRDHGNIDFTMVM